MRVVLMSDSLGELDPVSATACLVAGWRAGAPHDEPVPVPSSAGGPGMLGAVRASLGGVAPPETGAAVWATGPAASTTLWVDASTSQGPGTVGVGRAVADAVASGARRVVVGLGGVREPDGGAGLLAGLGLVGMPSGLGALAGLTPGDLAGLPELRRRLATVELVAAYDDDRPLLGMAGASAAVADDRAGGRVGAQALERALAGLSAAVGAALGDELRPDLLAPARQRPLQRLTSAPGAGAGGGLGFALAALGGRLLPGAGVLADAVGLDAVLDDAELAVVAAARLDHGTASAGVVGDLAARALERGLPVVALADEAVVGRRDLADVGLVGVYETRPGPDRLVELAARVARTWSPGR